VLSALRFAGLLLLALCACNKGSALVRMDVDAEPGLPIDSVELSLTSQQDGGQVHNRQVIDWPVRQSLSVGLYLPTSVSGQVWARARGLRGGNAIAEAPPQSVSVSPGTASGPVRFHLVGGPGSGADPGADGGRPPTDAGAPGDGGLPVDAVVPTTDVVPGDRPFPSPDGVTGPGGWLAPSQVEADPLNRDSEPVVAVDPLTGDAVALFIEKEAQLKASRYDRAANIWIEPQVIASASRMRYPQVGMDAGGHVFALWSQADSGVLECRSSDRGRTWTKPALIRTTTGAINTSLAVGRGNRARAAWQESVSSYNTMFTAYFDGTSWSMAAMPLASNDIFGTRQASIAVDGAGAGWIAWAQPEPMSPKASEHLYVSRFSGAALETPQIVDREGASVQPPPLLAMAPDGKAAVAVWQQNYAGGAEDFLASVWTGSGWSAPEKAVVGGGERPSVTMDATGAVTLAYQAILPVTATRNTLVVRREAGKWTAPKPLETDNTAPGGLPPDGEEPYPVARADAQGNVWVVWRKGRNATTYGISGARFAGGKWDPEVTIASRPNLAASWPLSMDITDDGRALVVWVYVKGSASAMDADLYNLYVAFSR
jgi:hypothetical protein